MKFSSSDVELIEQWWVVKSRTSFYHYRQFINYPKFKKGWFPQDLSEKLQQFYDDMVAGLRPILIIQAPPQHGKSTCIIDFLSWYLGKHPELKIIYGTFSERLGIRANRALQRIFDSRKHKLIFPDFHIGESNVVTIAGKLLRNNTIIETHEGGYFRNTTVDGSVTGETLDLGVVDDPIKGRKAANSKTTRDTAWDWLTDDVMTRFSEYAGLLMIATRWHIDDPIGRMIDQDDPDIKWLKYEAINSDNKPLFPQLKSLAFLLKRKAKMLLANWLSLYQGSPVVDGGNIIKSEWWRWGDVLPKIKYRFIVADTAQKKNNWNDFSVFQCWGMDWNNCIHLLDQYRERLTSPELRKQAKEFYDRHNGIKNEPLRGMWIEDKSSGSGLIQELELKKLKINAVQRSIDKIERANDVGPEIKSGKVFLYEWVPDVDVIVDEAAASPNGVNDDAWDCTMTAIEITYLDGDTVDYAGLI
ncbi:phage terminase large subunit [Candidatus Pacearchaeota archaeon]|nr:phage terminase large subunit [Candidatus Pacearchaeota archaeon]